MKLDVLVKLRLTIDWKGKGIDLDKAMEHISFAAESDDKNIKPGPMKLCSYDIADQI